MTELSDIIDIARRNFEDAQSNIDADNAAAGTPAEAKAIRANRDRALAAYMELLTATLDGFTGDWEALAGRARDAAEEVTDGTARAVRGAERIRLLAGVTRSLADIAEALD